MLQDFLNFKYTRNFFSYLQDSRFYFLSGNKIETRTILEDVNIQRHPSATCIEKVLENVLTYLRILIHVIC